MHMYEAKSTPTATGTAKTECPLHTVAAPLEEVLALEGFAFAALLLLVEVPEEAAGLSVELITGEVGDKVTVDVPCSTSKYIP
jgi:hypothetical protein